MAGFGGENLPCVAPRPAYVFIGDTLGPERTHEHMNAMKRKHTYQTLCLAVMLAGASQGVLGQEVTLPDTFALPASAADTSKPGFIWRVHQVVTGQPTTLARTEAQLAGELGDNIADLYPTRDCLSIDRNGTSSFSGISGKARLITGQRGT